MRTRPLDKRVAFLGRPDGTGPLTPRAEAWAEWLPLSSARKVEARGLTDGIEGTLRIRDTAKARTIIQTDRALFSGQDMKVLSTPVPDRSGFLWIKVGRQIGGS